MAIEVIKEDGIATVTIDRPDALNAFTTELILEMHERINELSDDSSVRVVILTGAGEKAFIAGADIQEMSEKDHDGAVAFSRRGHKLCDAIESMPQPVIAAINGFALGGGCEIAMACDIRIAADSAQLGQPEVGLGIPPAWGGTQRMPRIVGVGRAKELIFSGRHIGAEEAKEIGLVNAVYPADQVMPEARKLAQVFLEKGPEALAASKKLINRTMETSMATGNIHESKLFAAAFNGEEQSEGMEAFLQRRKPGFAKSSLDD
ncbi:MAG: enoyl-CoA hydratase-related protein [Thermomicrobiaceae bacterium]